MGIKSEKKRLANVLGTDSGKFEFTENLFDNFTDNKLSETSKKIIKNALVQKHSTEYKERVVIDGSKEVQWLRSTLAQFSGNITFDKIYQDCVIEFQNNEKRINMANLFASIRNSDNNRRKK